MSTTVIRILLVEDHLLARVGTATLLQTQADFHIVGEAVDGVQGLQLYRQLQPDLVIADMRMPNLDGAGFTEALLREAGQARILVLSHFIGDEVIFRAIHAGALGYVTKDTDAETLFAAVRTVARGQRYLPGEIATKFADRSMRKGLSPRELQVLELLHDGRANKEIADRLGVAERTVELHVGNVLTKLGAQSRTEAVSIALERGILISRSE